MKKFTKVFVVICLVLLIALCATACSLDKDSEGRYKLVAPKVTITNDTVTWEVVGYGKKYYEKFGVKIGDKEVNDITTNFYTLSEVEPGATVDVQVRAIGDGVKTVSSPYSAAISYKAPMRLASPTGVTQTENDNEIVISWDKVNNAQTYDIQQIEAVGKTTQWYRNISGTSFTIAKSNVSAPGKYYFKVLAKSDSQDYMDSALSNSQAVYVKTQKLTSPAPTLTSNNITWDEVSEASNFKIYMLKVDPSWQDENIAESHKDEALAVATVSKTSRSYTNSQVVEALNTYKTEWEKKNSGEFDTVGKYIIYIQSVHLDFPDVYPNSDMAAVTKTVNEDDANKQQVVQFTKPAKPQNIRITDDNVGEGEVQQIEKVLHWDAVFKDETDEFKDYAIYFYSNGMRILNTNVEDTKDSLTSRFTTSSNHRGKVMEISISVRPEFSEGILSGDESYYVDASGNNKTYTVMPTELFTVGGDGDYKDYYKIENLGDFQYMMQNSSAGNKYYLTGDIDGGVSGTNCNFYAGNNIFNGIFDGGNRVISNINIILQNSSQAISLFNEIANGAIFKNVTFNNVTITSEDGSVNNVALVAGTNNGTIKDVYVINSKFEAQANISGFVITNNGEINGCGMIDCTINAQGFLEEKEEETTRANVTAGKQTNAATIAITNNGTIFNASIYISKINAKSRLANVKAGGIVVNNTSTIKNSFVKNTFVNAETILDTTQVSAIAGGIAAVSNGTINECYVTNQASTTTSVQTNSGKLASSTLSVNTISGGLVGEMTGGSINHCYVSFMRIVADSYASGMVGRKGSANITLENSYVFNIRLNASDRAMVLTETNGVTVNSVYSVKVDANANENNIIAENRLGRADLVNTKIDGFAVYKTDYAEQPLLKNMLYTKNASYSVEYSKNANRTLSVYYVHDYGITVCNLDDAWKSSLETSGKKVDIYKTVIDPEVTNLPMVLPIYVTVK